MRRTVTSLEGISHPASPIHSEEPVYESYPPTSLTHDGVRTRVIQLVISAAGATRITSRA
jgi:hypothetical protein